MNINKKVCIFFISSLEIPQNPLYNVGEDTRSGKDIYEYQQKSLYFFISSLEIPQKPLYNVGEDIRSGKDIYEVQELNKLNQGETNMNIITKPEIKEICDGEIHDFILELVEQALEQAPQYQTNRRKELCQALLAANRVVGKRDTMCKNVGAVLKTWNASHKQVSILKKYGFSLNRGNNGHYKLRWNDSPYFETLSGSPSDHCSGRNASTTFKYNFFNPYK